MSRAELLQRLVEVAPKEWGAAYDPVDATVVINRDIFWVDQTRFTDALAVALLRATGCAIDMSYETPTPGPRGWEVTIWAKKLGEAHPCARDDNLLDAALMATIAWCEATRKDSLQVGEDRP